MKIFNNGGYDPVVVMSGKNARSFLHSFLKRNL